MASFSEYVCQCVGFNMNPERFKNSDKFDCDNALH